MQIVAGALACLSAAPASAGQWTLGGSASQQFQYEDNVTLATTGDKVSTPASISTLGLDVGNATPVFDAFVTSLFRFSSFFEEPGLDSNDQTVNAGIGYRSEIGEWRLQGSVIRDTTRTSDLLGTGQFVLDNKRRNLFTGGPSWSYQLDPLNTFELSAAYTVVDYPSGGDELVDYWQASGGGFWTRRLTETIAFQTQVSSFHYETTNVGDLKNDYVNLLFGLVYTPTERWQLSAAAGPAVTISDGSISTTGGRSDSEGAEAGYAIRASAVYLATDDITLRANVDRTAQPNVTSGVLQEVTALRLAYEQFLLPKTAVYVNGLYQHQDQVGRDSTRDYLTLEPGVRVRLSEDFDLWCAYRVQWQEYEQQGASGVSNTVLARLSYRFPTWSEAP